MARRDLLGAAAAALTREESPAAEPVPPVDDGWTSEVSSSYALTGFLALVFVGFTLLAMGPLEGIDSFFNVHAPPATLLPGLHVLDRIGQRLVCMPILALAVLLACRRIRSWRPAVLAALATFTLNCVVGALKLALGRAEPATGNPHFFAGGIAYPSGHTANIVLVYGLVAYLLSRYLRVRPGVVRLLWVAVSALSALMVVTSLLETWHWFADLIAGLIVGGIMLQLTTAVDTAVPRDAFQHGWRMGLRIAYDGILRRPRAGAPEPAVVPAAPADG